ncbi:cyclophilin-like fold protein [Ellagibacter isourolithinifaciens]|uniref:cyclophilin-like fold protein n=1 Tax=Ellagibacter isourolithinifaciens TaxID=2137581 RepID=UPI003AEFB07A
MKRAIVVVALAGLLALAGCAQAQNSASSTAGGSSSSSASSSQAEVGSGSSATGASPAASPAVATSAESEEAVIVITAGDASFEMTPADTDAARELVGKLQDGPVTVSLHAYGGFEHVGPLPWSLPQNDEQVTSIPGDVMLYQGDQITIFHGSNSWAYTPLGHIEGATADSLLAAFGDGDADVMLSIAGN